MALGERLFGTAREAVARCLRLFDAKAERLDAIQQGAARALRAIDDGLEGAKRVQASEQQLQRPNRNRLFLQRLVGFGEEVPCLVRDFAQHAIETVESRRDAPAHCRELLGEVAECKVQAAQAE